MDQLSPLGMAAVIIHETLHSEFHRWVYEDRFPFPFIEEHFESDSDFWREIVRERYGEDAPINHHALMTYFVDRIAEDLWKLNGETDRSRIDNYKYFAYDLFTIDDERLITFGFLTPGELQRLKQLGETISSNIQCN